MVSKQSPRQWYLKFNNFMMKLCFQRCNLDCCVYYRKISVEKVYLVLYVDDMLIASKSMKQIDLLKQQLRGEFEIKDLGPAKKILGMQLIRDRKYGSLFLTQEDYINKVLDKFEMRTARPVQTPLLAHFRLSEQQCPITEADKSEMMRIPYASVVGCLMYALILTKPDIAYVVSVISRYMANPRNEHWKAVNGYLGI